jgi:exonuclease VII large subunit
MTDDASRDPTRNVLNIVSAESRHQDAMREAQAKLGAYAIKSEAAFQNFARDSESRMQSWMRDAESKRVDQLADQREKAEGRIAAMLAKSVETTSSLVATQLLQIQSTFGERVSKLEEFRLLSTGRSSVADPQIASSLDALSKSIAETQVQFTKALASLADKQTAAMDGMAHSILTIQEAGSLGAGKIIGHREVLAWVISAVSIGGFVMAVIFHMEPVAAHLG